jgi:hypothetical protein
VSASTPIKSESLATLGIGAPPGRRNAVLQAPNQAQPRAIPGTVIAAAVREPAVVEVIPAVPR